jgi:hypothetical protein
VDLGSSGPAGYVASPGPAARWLDTSEVRQSLKKRLNLLEKGTAPSEMQLGEDCVQPACGEVLRHVYRRWCKGGVVRGSERRPTDGKCVVVGGIEAIHYYLSGRKPFRQPGYSDDAALRREREEMATFGRVAPRRPDNFSQQQGFRAEDWQVLEEWQTVDESAAGLHAARPSGLAGARFSPGQLVAV